MPIPIHDIFMDKLFQGLDKFTEEETGTYVAKVREGPWKKKCFPSSIAQPFFKHVF